MRLAFPKRLFVFAAAFLALLVDGAAAEKLRPNFVIILADDMGYGELSCYGNSHYETPHLDALAASGMRFTDFHSNGAVCSPTRAALLTGRYQQRTGVTGVIYADPKQNRHHGLQVSELTFAEVLKKAGYRTGCFGKWHLGYEKPFHPPHHGFDRFRGYVSGNIDYQSHYDRMGVYDWWHDEKTAEEPGYSTHLITKHAVEFIEESKDRPFCAYIAHEAPHTPYQGPEDPGFRVAGKVVGEKRTVEFRKRAYREMVEELDRGVGDIVATLKRLGLEKSTLVFFFSDNGATGFAGQHYAANSDLRGTKGTLWEGGTRVPAIASWPGKIEAGASCGELAAGFDLFATMAELADAKLPEGHRLDGISLAPLFRGKRWPGPRQLAWSYRRASALRDGRWKLVVGARGLKGQSPALFDLESDPSEKTNLAEKHAKRVLSMSRTLQSWRDDVERGATPQPERR